MRRRWVRFAALAAIVGIVASTPPAPATAEPFSHPITRVFGATRMATSIEVSRLGWDTAPHVLLATGEDFPDALGATPLAASLDAPLLLLHDGYIGEEVFDELDRLGTQVVTILGGGDVVEASGEDHLAGRGIKARRIAGADRYATAAQIATEVGRSPTGQAVVASGEFFADAMAAGALSAGPDRLPVLLASMHDVPDVTMAALRDLGVTEIMLIGGTGILSPAVEQELTAAGMRVARFAGPNRFATSARVATEAFARIESGDVPLVLAVGTAFADALAAGPLMARLDGVLLLLPPNDLGLAPEGVRFVRDRLSRLTTPLLLGGTAAVNGIVEWQMRAVLGGDAVPAAAFGDGSYRLGDGFPAGTYRTLGSAEGCYWERLRGVSGHPNEIIANEISPAPMTVTVEPSDAAFRVSRCGIWTADITPDVQGRDPGDSFGEGTWLVEAEVEPGTWSSPGGGTCYWERLSGFGGEADDVVASGVGGTVTIAAGDLGFRSRRCGSWNRVG
ncbi:MAG TPA: cell wall-binding repeat-containing protein [Acidimicrobiales bacterium]|nr:cell wall-binding repeat-containing protein [Acidimicrobiales bacterium]